MQTALNTVMEQAAVATQPRRRSAAEIEERLGAIGAEISETERAIDHHEAQRREMMARVFVDPQDADARRAEKHHGSKAAEAREKLAARRIAKQEGERIKAAAAEADRFDKLKAAVPLGHKRIAAAKRVDEKFAELAEAIDIYETIVREMAPLCGGENQSVLPAMASNPSVRLKLAVRHGLPRRLVGILAEAPNLTPAPARSLEQSDRDLLARLLELEAT